MATVINTPATRESDGAAAAGWAVAVVVLVAAILVALFVWPGYAAPAAAPQNPGTNINVTLPQAGGGSEAPAGGSGTGENTGGSSGAPSGGAGGGM